MPLYAYKSRGRDGAATAGQVETPDKISAIEALTSAGQTLVSLKEVKTQSDWKAWFQSRQSDLTVKDVGAFSEDLSRLLGSGFSLLQALQMVAVSTDSRRAEALARRAADEVAKGERLSSLILAQSGGPAQALGGLVQAGESAGELEQILADAARSFRASADFKDRLSSALIYPFIVLFMISLTLIIFFSFVLPKLRPLFDDVGDRLPWATKALLSFGRFCEAGLPWVLLGSLGLFIAVQLMPKLKASISLRVHSWLMGGLGLGAARLTAYAAYGRTLGLLLNSGMPLPAAHTVAGAGVGNQSLQVQLSELTGGLRSGQSLTSALESLKHCPDVLSRMVYLGERSGKLGPALTDAAGLLERKARSRTDRLLAALTPIITIVLGLLVALIVGALFLGIASLTDVDL